MSNVVTIEPELSSATKAVTLAAGLTPMAMLDRAVAQGAGIEVLEKLLALQERWDANQGRRAFDAAMAMARAEVPVILKNRTVDFTSAKGRTHYRHEDMAGIARAIDPILAKHGLSYRFRTTSNVNEPITVTCIVSHRDGHSEENTLCAGRDETGNKNNIQGIGSTITYLQRYTLKAALGLAASDDDDAHAVAAGNGSNGITVDQIQQLQSLIVETNTDLTRFYKHFRIERLEGLRAADYNRAVGMLKAKQAKETR